MKKEKDKEREKKAFELKKKNKKREIKKFQHLGSMPNYQKNLTIQNQSIVR